MTQPILSVIIPVYNVESYIERCVESILSQNIPDIEIIMIDDGSKDNSAEICQKLQNQNPCIIFESQSNQGVSTARNHGLKIAHGRYLTFVDPDDYLGQKTLKPLLKYLACHSDIDFIQYPYCDIFQDGRCKINKPTELVVCGHKEIFKHWWSGSPLTFTMWNKIFKKELFDGLKFWEGHTSEDTILVSYLHQRANKVYISEQGMYCYEHREGSYTSIPSYENNIDLFHAHFAIYRQFKLYPDMVSEKVQAFTRMFRRLIFTKQHYPDRLPQEELICIAYYFPTWKEIFTSEKTEKLWLSCAKLLGTKTFCYCFIKYLWMRNHRISAQ